MTPGERWQIRGHRLRYATVMPCLGSYRHQQPRRTAHGQHRAERLM